MYNKYTKKGKRRGEQDRQSYHLPKLYNNPKGDELANTGNCPSV
jgi:hypothetical protein